MTRDPLDKNPRNSSPAVRAARIYSNVFSPPSMFALVGFIIAWIELPFLQGTLHAAIFGFLSTLVPILYIVYMLKTGKIDDLHISKQSERHIPYILGILGASLAYFILRGLASSSLLLTFILTNISAISLLAIINARWLISAHTTSISAIATFAGIGFGIGTGIAILPMVAMTFYVRHFLKRHTIAEMIGGCILGIAIVMTLAALGAFNL